MDAYRPVIRGSRHAMAMEYCVLSQLRVAIVTDGGDPRRPTTVLGW